MGKSRKSLAVAAAGLCISIVLVLCFPIQADEFTKKDLDRWQKEFMTVVAEGEKLFHSSSLGKNKVSCDQCHPNGANTHPETYPKFQKQPGQSGEAAGDDQRLHSKPAGRSRFQVTPRGDLL